MRRAILILAAVAALVVGGALAAAPRSECAAKPTLTVRSSSFGRILFDGRRAAKPTLTVRSSSFGRILFDGRGFVLYAFTRDPKKRSACSGACATAWPPYLLKGRLLAGRGITKSLLGTTGRPNGARQVTYAGRPLYFYVGDRRAGQILCQNVREFGGLWLVVNPSGAFVR